MKLASLSFGINLFFLISHVHFKNVRKNECIFLNILKHIISFCYICIFDLQIYIYIYNKNKHVY